MQAGKHISPYYINEEPVDRLYSTGWPVHSTGRHWSFLDAPPKMANGYQLQNNLWSVDVVSRPIEATNFFLQKQNGKLLPVAKQTATGWCIASTDWNCLSFMKKKYSRLTIFVDIIVD